MQKSIKTFLVLLMAVAMFTSFVPVMASDVEIQPISTSNPTLNVTYATSQTVTGGKMVTSAKSAEDGTAGNGMRVYVNVKNAEGTGAYSYGSYLVYTLDIAVNERYETNTIATDTYARVYFGSAIVANIPGSALGTTGTSSKLTVINTPEQEVYVYYNGHLIGRAPNQAAPATISDIRYYEKSAVDPTKSNVLTFTNPTVTHYDASAELDDILKMYETPLTYETTNTIRNNYGTSDGNTFTSVTTAGGNSGWGIWVQCNFKEKLPVSRNLIYITGSVKVENRVETNDRITNCPITITIEGTQANNTASLRRQYLNVPCDTLEEGNEYPFTVILDKSNVAHCWINDTYASQQLSNNLDYQRISYTEGGVTADGEGNVFTIEPLTYTVYPYSYDLSDFVDNIDISDATAVFSGTTLIDEDINLTTVKDAYGNSALTEDTTYILAASKFSLGMATASDTLEYGMLISDEPVDNLTVDNCALKGVAVRNVDGSYGILFYGNKIVPGNTYYIRPYVSYNGEYLYGTASEYTIPASDKE